MVWVLKIIIFDCVCGFFIDVVFFVGKNNNGVAECIFYLTKKSNQPEDGS